VCGGDDRLGNFQNSCRPTVVRFPLAPAILILVLGTRIKEKPMSLVRRNRVLIDMKFEI
jgi:hypothetical protein